jgi:hypothetical protein
VIDFEYLQRGLFGMANAHRGGSMAGHLGAAVIAGYFFSEDHPDLEDGVFAGVRRDLQRITEGEEAFWFNEKKAGIKTAELFDPFPKEKVQPNATNALAAALSRNIDQTRQSGHNVIFASIAIRALADHTDLAGPKLVGGLAKLIASFDGAHAGRGYYGKGKGWKNGNAAPVADSKELPFYSTVTELADVMLDQLIETGGQHRRGFGGLFHLLNHAAALAQLHQFGFKKLAIRGIPAHRHHLLLHRALPDLTVELGPLEAAPEDPLKSDYWKRRDSRQWSGWLTHRIKTLYGFHTLLGYVENKTKRERALKSFRYLMA